MYGELTNIQDGKITLKVGDSVMPHPELHYNLKGKTVRVLSVRKHAHCTSGYLIKVDGYPREIDSSWVKKA